MKIGIFGRVNVGKSTLLNAMTGQNVAIVSAEAGTTTDPVRRAYELAGVGKVTLIDTAGFDDRSPLGQQRLRKTLNVIDEVDLAVFIISGQYVDCEEKQFVEDLDCPTIIVGSRYDVDDVLRRVADLARIKQSESPSFYGDLLHEREVVLLVCPIDSGAPHGRLILPQVQALRAALDLHSTAVVVQPQELAWAIDRYMPNLIVTDSQVFDIVQPIVGDRATLTSFSILLGQQKGDPGVYGNGLRALNQLNDHSSVLMIEHCSHGISCQDIARIKIPALIEQRLGVKPHFEIISGRDPLPEDLSIYTLAVQCGGCMADSRPIKRRIERCVRAGLPITNYGMLLKELKC